MSTDTSEGTAISAQILLNRTDLRRLGIKVSNSSLLRWEGAGRFPRRIRMAGTRVAWIASEISEWVCERARERSKHTYAEF